MNLDELVSNIQRVSDEEVVQKLADHIIEWKTNEDNVVDLSESVERFIGNTWIDKRADHDKIYGMWSRFKTSAIESIGGMTMNERLYWFGLIELFDKASNNAEQEKFFVKLTPKKSTVYNNC